MATLGIEADWWLYVVLFAAIFLLLAINVYIVVIWQHPDDKNEAYFPKAIVVRYIYNLYQCALKTSILATPSFAYAVCRCEVSSVGITV